MRFICLALAAAAAHAAAVPNSNNVWFEKNHGQAAPNVRFLARAPGYHLYLNPTSATAALFAKPGDPARTITMELIGANNDAPMAGLDPDGGHSSYFSGTDCSRWLPAIPHFTAVQANGVWSGIAIRYYQNTRRAIEHDFLIAPGADPAAIRFRLTDFDGQQNIQVMSVLINDTLDPRRACWFGYHRPSNSVLLVNDDASGIQPPLVMGASGSIQNSQCIIDSEGFSLTPNAQDLLVDMRIRFRPAFSGSRVIYVSASDATGASPWRPAAFHRVQP